MLIKMYTNQCFHKYPHFQLSELNENKKYSNNANRFSSSHEKGKQGYKTKGKGKGKNRDRKWRDGKAMPNVPRAIKSDPDRTKLRAPKTMPTATNA
jgi:hypothetical protein